jgi:hypothetical protein
MFENFPLDADNYLRSACEILYENGSKYTHKIMYDKFLR